jgi:hypothetical protein
MARRRGAWWIAGVVLPLVLGGLILMHAVELGPSAETSASAHREVVGAAAGTELHGEHEACDDCHVGLHVTAACVAVLGSIAVWRLAARPPGRTKSALVGSSSSSRWPSLALDVPGGRPSWIRWGVMLC